MKIHTRLTIGFTVLLLSLLCSVAIEPSFVFHLPQGGLSNYFTDGATMTILSFGFLVAASLFGWAGHRVSDFLLRRVLYGYAVLLLVLIISTYPYKSNELFETIHIVTGLTVATYQIVTTYLLRKYIHTPQTKRLIIGIFILSMIASVLTIFNIVGLLFVAQIFAGLYYGITLISAAQSKRNAVRIS